jgi:outer membrane protein OmpA-like peptidoglycan-associated protein
MKVTNRGHFRWAGLLALGALGTPAVSSAQDIQNFRPAPGATNYITAESALVAPDGRLVPSLWVNYGKNPVVRRDQNDKIVETIIGQRTTAEVGATYGLLDRVEVGLIVPIHQQSGDVVDATGDDGVGLGDVRLVPKLRLLGSRDASGVGLAVSAPISLPTSADKEGMGDGILVFSPRAIAEARLHGLLRVGVNFGMRLRTENKTVDPGAPTQGAVATKGVEVGNEFAYSAGFGVHPGTESLEILGEVFGAAPAEDVDGGENAKPLEAVGGLRYYAQNGLTATAGAGAGVVADYGSPDYRVFVGLAWEPRSKDTDGDGLFDNVDTCPTEPEDKDRFRDDDGCPDPDNDDDGLLDTVDKCPDQPESRNGFEDEDGCPDQGDTDGDGLRDPEDACPNEPEDKDAFEDENGCPDPDNDADGVLDAADACPLVPEDKDDFEDADGCPDPDNDRDGVLDADDKCPKEPETINGLDDQDGCPDAGVSSVRVTSTKIEILDKVFFDNDKDTIKPVSFPILDQVVSVLKANTQIQRIRVEGHTDRWGPPEHNLDLSKRRALSVKNYLISKGVEENRLESEGYGPTRPLDPRKNFAADDKNRRVEFVIVPVPAAP